MDPKISPQQAPRQLTSPIISTHFAQLLDEIATVQRRGLGSPRGQSLDSHCSRPVSLWSIVVFRVVISGRPTVVQSWGSPGPTAGSQ